MDELDQLLAEKMDEFLEEDVDLPHTPESEEARVFWGLEASEVGSDEGDGENESTFKLEDEQGEASGTLDIPLRIRTVTPAEQKAASAPESTTAAEVTSTPRITTASTESFLRDSASSAKEGDASQDTALNTGAETKRGRGSGGR